MVIVVLGLLLFLNAIFAMAELAMMTSRQSRLEQEAAKGNSNAAAALKLAQNPSHFLSTVQVGITLIGILSGAIGYRALADDASATLQRWGVASHYAERIALAVVVLVIAYLSLVLGELFPKRVALAYPEPIATLIAKPLRLLSILAAPAVKLLTLSTEVIVKVFRIREPTHQDISEDDVRATLSRAADTGVFDEIEHELFERVFTVADLRVKALMVPRSEIVCIEESMPTNELRVLVGIHPYSHFPVCRGGLDALVGVVHIKDLMTHGLIAGTDFKVVSVAQKPLFVPEAMPALKLLETFHQARQHIAFVVDEYGVVEGLITLNDLVQALVGDITRHGQPDAPEAIQRDDGSWLLDGRLALHEMLATLDIPSDAKDDVPGVSTVAGLVVSLLGRVPRRGEWIAWRGLRLEVVDMDRQRVDEVLAIPIAHKGGASKAE